jgi:hypothetical protein
LYEACLYGQSIYMRACRISIAFFVTAFLVNLYSPLYAESNEDVHDTSVILVLIDTLSLDDVLSNEAEGLREIAGYGGVGLINLRVGGGPSKPAGYLTIGSGARAVAGDLSDLAFSITEEYQHVLVSELYPVFTGETLDGSIVYLGWPQLSQIKQIWNAHPGLLGELLNQAGLDVRVYGNADTPFGLHRYGVLVAMDALGRVKTGSVAKADLLFDPDWPFDLRTDYDLLIEQISTHVNQPGLTVVDLGDLARLSDVSAYLSPEKLAFYRRITLRRISQFMVDLEEVLIASDLNHFIYILSPSPNYEDLSKGYLLGPIIMGEITQGAVKTTPKIITSSTTRRIGIAANYDLTGTILQHFSLSIDDVIGRPIITVPSSDVWKELENLFTQIARVHSQRNPIVKTFIYIQVGVIIISVLVLTLFNSSITSVGWMKNIYLLLHSGLVAYPLALLLLPLLPGTDSLIVVALQIVLLIAMIMIPALLMRRLGFVVPLLFILALTVIVILTDTISGANLMKKSHLGYDAMGGSRYYGIGNEYMGILIGSCIMASGGILDWIYKRKSVMLRKSVYLLFLIYALIVLALASPWHGINFGGAVTAVVGFGVSLCLLLKRKLSIRRILNILGVLLLSVVVILLVDIILLKNNGSHVGQAFMQTKNMGLGVLWNIVQRKAAMNFSLLQLTIWSYAFLISLAVTSILMILPSSFLKRSLTEHTYSFLAVKATLVAAITALMVNDSGIVAAAVMMIPAVSTSCYLLVYSVKKDK